jgi:hypothetical protein
MKAKIQKIINVRLIDVLKAMLLLYVAFCIVNTSIYLMGTRVHVTNVFNLVSPVVEATK